MRGLFLLAMLALMIPATSASPCGGDCVTHDEDVGTSGADAGVGVHIGNGVGAGTHAGGDGAYVTVGVGITRCTVGTGPSGCVY